MINLFDYADQKQRSINSNTPFISTTIVDIQRNMVSKAARPQLELFFDNLLLLGLLLRNTDIEINIIDARSGDQRFLAIFGIDSSNFNVSKKVHV